jgi:ornithine cyclodeaminase
MIRIVEEGALREAVTPERAVAVIRDAFRADGEGRTRVPPVINLDVPHGEFHIKTAHIGGVPHVAVKIASGFYGNALKGLPTGSGLMALFDADTGLPSALLLDNGYLTDVRTGAAGAVAAEFLAPRLIDTVGVIGSGVQARHQVHCLRVVREFTRVVAWSPNAAHLNAYCEEMRGAGFEVTAAASAEDVCAAAELIITSTPSREPLLHADWLKDGVHLTAVGSDTPGKQELSPFCLIRADVVAVDRLSQCSSFGELKHALDAGMKTEAIELGQIVAGRRPGRTSDKQITVADLTGVGFQDTAIASAALAWMPSSRS